MLGSVWSSCCSPHGAAASAGHAPRWMAAASVPEEAAQGAPRLPPFDYEPMPYTGPSKEEVYALRKQYLNPGGALLHSISWLRPPRLTTLTMLHWSSACCRLFICCAYEALQTTLMPAVLLQPSCTTSRTQSWWWRASSSTCSMSEAAASWT